MKDDAEYKLGKKKRKVSLLAKAYKKYRKWDGLSPDCLTQFMSLKGMGPFQDSRLSLNACKYNHHFSRNVRRRYRG